MRAEKKPRKPFRISEWIKCRGFLVSLCYKRVTILTIDKFSLSTRRVPSRLDILLLFKLSRTSYCLIFLENRSRTRTGALDLNACQQRLEQENLIKLLTYNMYNKYRTVLCKPG